jgi:hypothetical protein
MGFSDQHYHGYGARGKEKGRTADHGSIPGSNTKKMFLPLFYPVLKI